MSVQDTVVTLTAGHARAHPLVTHTRTPGLCGFKPGLERAHETQHTRVRAHQKTMQPPLHCSLLCDAAGEVTHAPHNQVARTPSRRHAHNGCCSSWRTSSLGSACGQKQACVERQLEQLLRACMQQLARPLTKARALFGSLCSATLCAR
jgi:hypothetical protein